MTGGRETEGLQVVRRDVGADVVVLALLPTPVAALDHLPQVVVQRDVREHPPAGDELDLVDGSTVARIRHRQEQAIVLHEDRKDQVLLRDLLGDEAEVLERNDDLREVDPRQPMLLAQRLEEIHLFDAPTPNGRRREPLTRMGLLLGEQRLELRRSHELLRQEDLAELLLSAGAAAAHGPLPKVGEDPCRRLLQGTFKHPGTSTTHRAVDQSPERIRYSLSSASWFGRARTTWLSRTKVYQRDSPAGSSTLKLAVNWTWT